jgi:thiol:disulfide interchange protein
MLMDPRYKALLQAMADRDATLAVLAVIAISLVAAWVILGRLPIKPAWSAALQKIYMAGGIVLYLVTIAVSVFGGKK